MKDLTVNAKCPAKGDQPERTATIVVKYPETIEEAVQVFGAEAVLTNAKANWVVTLQSGIRAALTKGKTQEEVAAHFAGAKMGVATSGLKADPEQAFFAKFQAATPEERDEMLKRLRAKAAGK